MTERLTIRNFAGLDHIEIELGLITIFIGPQASGKSVCAKAIYWFKSFLPELFNSINKGQTITIFEDMITHKFKEYFPNLWRSSNNFVLRYEVLDFFIQIEGNKNNVLKLIYSDIFTYIANESKKEVDNFHQQSMQNPRQYSIFDRAAWEPKSLQNLKSSIYEKAGNELEPIQSYVLAGRSFFSSLKGAVLSFLLNTPSSAIDPFLKDFIRQYEISRRFQLVDGASYTAHFAKIIQEIMKGQFAFKGDEDYITTDDGRYIPLANASSGQQEVFPLLLILLSLLPNNKQFEDSSDERQIVYIEEPEAHLFPESQRAISNLMAHIYNSSPWNLQYIITTHSPYLLSSFNNIIYAYYLSQQLINQPEKLEQLYKIIPKSQQLPLSNFRVYGLENGSAKSLIDHELGLLSADLLDSASDITATQFGELMTLDSTTQV